MACRKSFAEVLEDQRGPREDHQYSKCSVVAGPGEGGGGGGGWGSVCSRGCGVVLESMCSTPVAPWLF